MNRNLLVLGLIAIFLSACSQDPTRYDVKSPCVASISGMYADDPCMRRLPIENFQYVDTIANL